MKTIVCNEQAGTRPHSSTRAALVAAVLFASVAGLAATSFIRTGPAGAEERASAGPTIPMLPTPSDRGHFAFGYVEFDWNSADGVAGFDVWPPGTRRR
jgi:hypothetical protein